MGKIKEKPVMDIDEVSEKSEEKEETNVDIFPIEKKLTLSANEASKYTGIGLNTIYRMMENPSYNIVLWIGKKKRIKRLALEQLISQSEFIDD